MSDTAVVDPNAAGPFQSLSDDELRGQLRAARQEMKRRGLVPAKKAAAKGAGRKAGGKAGRGGGKAGRAAKAGRRAKRRAAAAGAAGGDAA
jgi:hypothetical protein